MKLDRPTSLGKSIEVTASNRPVKIAYLVPFDDVSHTHMNLDAVFFESYTRWAGLYTLIIPTKAQEFLLDGYDDWLKHFDPDFIYSYVDLDTGFVDKIDRLCCPIAFIRHKERKRHDHEIEWRSFLPSWYQYIQPVSSMSTIQNPSSYPQFPHEERPREPTIFTQYRTNPANRFLADNFGTGFSLLNVTNSISGFFKTLCLVPSNLPEKVVAGTEHCFSVLEAFRAISERKVTPIARLAMVNSAGIPRPESLDWAYAFRIFVGRSPLDRIHFWNSRHIGNRWSDTSNALILEPDLFDDENFVKQLGQYLNNHNFISNGNGPYRAEIHSTSEVADVLLAIRNKLKPHTWNVVSVSDSFNAQAIPSKKDLSHSIHEKITDTTKLKLTEDFSEIKASEPAHFIYMPPQLRGLVQGQWVVELSIQRHNNLSKYSNVIDTWTLPRRSKISGVFTDRLAKPTYGGQLALLPSVASFPFRNQAIKDSSSYEIHLPSDEMFFRYLAFEFFQYPFDDLRGPIQRKGYVDLVVSDKGQNLRGVISMFDNLSAAFGILTNKFWRNVLAEAKEDSVRPFTFDLNKLDSLIPNDRKTIKTLTEELRFKNSRITKNYLSDSLRDTLELLVRSNIFYKVAHWRCRYCGHMNSRSFDNMKIKNECDICTTEYHSPIDIEWKYELNDFVYRSLQKHSGLTVLWTLGFLQDRSYAGNFWYLPEVDLYERDNEPQSKNEIDILCMLDGVFYAVEAKKSASIFINKQGAIDKFIKVIEMLRPDVAVLAFERYCLEKEEEQEMKSRLVEVVKVIQERISPWTKLETHVAQEVAGYNDFPTDLGFYGPRVHKYS